MIKVKVHTNTKTTQTLIKSQDVLALAKRLDF